MITLEQYFMGRDKSHKDELTPEIINKAKTLLDKVNRLLLIIVWDEEVEITSGWRPESLNAKVKGASKKSAHTLGMAIDIKDDKKQSLAKRIRENIDMLKILGLWLENPDFTKGQNTNWVHLDFKVRSERPENIFNP